MKKPQVNPHTRIYLYIMGRTVQPCFLATESAVRIEEERNGEDDKDDAIRLYNAIRGSMENEKDQ